MSPNAAASPVPETFDESPLRAIADAFVSAWNRHDMADLARLFAADADFVNVVGMWWRNRREIEAAHVHSHATFFRNSRLTGRVEAVKLLRPQVATAHIVWELTGQIEPDGTTGAPRRGILLLVLTRNEGNWSIEAAQNTDIVAGAITQAAAPAS